MMRIELYTNLNFDADDNIICKRNEGLVISNMMIDFDSPFDSYEKDHCECIKSSVEVRGSRLVITLITEKNDIDEFMVFRVFRSGKPETIKLRFIR